MLVTPAFAKVNLALETVGRRADGLHDIESVVVAIDWHDLVGLTLSLQDSDHSLQLTGTGSAGVPSDATNISLRAARALSELASRRVAARVWLDKRLPTGGGLGGGSADAAAVLRSGLRLLDSAGIAVPDSLLQRVACRLGADVPAMLTTGVKLVTGAGERLQPCSDRDLHLTVAIAGASDTGAAYGALQTGDLRAEGRVRRVARALGDGVPPDDADLGSALEGAACAVNPALTEGLNRLRRSTPDHRWHMTGSGGCAFSLVASAAEADGLARRVRRSGLRATPCRSVPAGLTGNGLVAGPATPAEPSAPRGC
ncbi:MAG: 4-(cytidine 5'-diphospho)-2-C-methyl-D-erythritol kinase [Candidatus Dormibacteria bacterium]